MRAGRDGGRVMRRIISDEYPVYVAAIRRTYGRVVTPLPTGKPGRPWRPSRELPAGVTYATVHQEKENNRVVRVSTTEVFGTRLAVVVAFSRVSRTVT